MKQTTKKESNELQAWRELVMAAKEMGYTIEEIREFIETAKNMSRSQEETK